MFRNATANGRPCYLYIPKSSKLPPLYTHDGNPDAPVTVKLFAPGGTWTWYLTEYDPEHQIAYGLCLGHEPEMGYVDLNEVSAVRVPPFNLPIERDVYWTPRPLAQVRADIEEGKRP